jgi:hypothetical protein
LEENGSFWKNLEASGSIWKNPDESAPRTNLAGMAIQFAPDPNRRPRLTAERPAGNVDWKLLILHHYAQDSHPSEALGTALAGSQGRTSFFSELVSNQSVIVTDWQLRIPK